MKKTNEILDNNNFYLFFEDYPFYLQNFAQLSGIVIIIINGNKKVHKNFHKNFHRIIKFPQKFPPN